MADEIRSAAMLGRNVIVDNRTGAGGTIAEYALDLAQDLAKWSKVLREAGIKLAE
ncbi:hypothetical protein [Enterovirga aerilata]|uniref:Uncharacterized protein n=1 Tax=Enterovirga aerilata TaxID=2730920 RepID=A0A849ID08_9HYPH|nr:hypothetical protein [Enterovirga sp. DB1703]NNM75278.1 hypothetical protein [Enterovirga sp. DB1703]